jgi:hypothetical protein
VTSAGEQGAGNVGAVLATRDLRKLLKGVLRSDADLDAFALDYFPAVHERWTGGMDRVQKVNVLLVCVDPVEIQAALHQAWPEETDAFLRSLAARPAVDTAAPTIDLKSVAVAGGGGAGARFVVPFLRHPGFVGREEDLARVHALLQKGEAVGVRPVAADGSSVRSKFMRIG